MVSEEYQLRDAENDPTEDFFFSEPKAILPLVSDSLGIGFKFVIYV
jgi:hypothetical protein